MNNFFTFFNAYIYLTYYKFAKDFNFIFCHIFIETRNKSIKYQKKLKRCHIIKVLRQTLKINKVKTKAFKNVEKSPVIRYTLRLK